LLEQIVDVMQILPQAVTLIAPGTNSRYVAASKEAALRYGQLQTESGEGSCRRS